MQMRSAEGITLRNFIICTIHPIESGWLSLEEDRSAFKILTGTPTGKRSLGKPRCRWEDNIRMDLKQRQGIGLIRLRIEIVGRFLRIRQWTSGYQSHGAS